MTYICGKLKFLFKGVRGYRRYMEFIYDLRDMADHLEVGERLKIIRFFDKHGLVPAREAFDVSRSSIFRWKKLLKGSGGKVSSLVNRSRRPHNTRRMYLDEKTYLFIKNLREEHPRMGKEKIKILLDEYCDKERLEKLSASKIGRVIKKNNWYLYLGKRNKKRLSVNKKRVLGYEVKEIGDLVQMDTIVRFEHGIKRYIFTAIDIRSKFAFAFTYRTKSSKSGADFIEKLQRIVPFSIGAIQTDNGSEFLGQADKTMQKYGIAHLFSYPRSPKQNAFIERLNRTLQEEFVEEHRDLLELDLNAFNDKLIDYLLFYDTRRPHHSLGLKVPMKAVVDKLYPGNGEKSNMYWTNTLS